MSNLNNQENPNNIPFRVEVPVEEFQNIENARHEIFALPNIVTNPEDRVLGAELMQQIIVDPERPAEVKLEAIQKAIELITGFGYDEHNREVATVLIDTVRGVKEPALRIRLAAVISHALQNKYALPKDQSEDIDIQKIYDSFKRQEAFQMIIKENDSLPEHKAWARALLTPGGEISVFNELYDKNSDLNFLPRVLEEVVDIKESGMPQEVVTIASDLEEYIQVRLDPPRIYSPEKRKIYVKVFGHEPSLYVTRKVGAKFVHIEFPTDLSERISYDVEEFRSGNITRKEVFNRVQKIWENFQDRMNDEQRLEFHEHIKDNNLEIRFATLRPIKSEEDEEDENEEGESRVA